MEPRRLIRKPKPDYQSQSSSYQQQLFDHTLKLLQQKLQSEEQLEQNIQKRLRQDLAEYKRKQNNQYQQRRDYAQDLLKQIQTDKHKKVSETAQRRKMGISPLFHGYPNLPETPPQVRRKREIERMNKFRKELDEQMNTERQSLNLKQKEERKRDLEYIAGIKQSLELQKELKILKKQKQKELLGSFWQRANETKQIKQKIERIARNQAIDRKVRNQTSLPNLTISNRIESGSWKFGSPQISSRKQSGRVGVIDLGNQMVKEEEKIQGISCRNRKERTSAGILQSQSKKVYQNRIQNMVDKAKSVRNLSTIPENGSPRIKKDFPKRIR